MYIHISTRTHIHAYIIHTTIAHTVTHSALITPLKAYCVGGSKMPCTSAIRRKADQDEDIIHTPQDVVRAIIL